ncbi:MAG: YebC/PmpR family DNA-binding transcriptional regulator [Eubacteriales bacterium]|nr:YebC/PmpR family DNA-binding transcriptional regulator [Eubacteriales bacterium]
MAGHSKWSNIKHKKGKADAARGKIFTKIGREIAMAVREGGSDPEVNGKLRDVIAKARSNNMPNDNIERSIKKASGELGNVNYEEIVYEGYAPGGIAVILEVVTDNRNRTASDVRHIFDKNGGTLGQTGSVGYLFNYQGTILIENNDSIDEDELMMNALQAGAEDVQTSDEGYEIITAASDFSAVREALEKKGYQFVSAERGYVANMLNDVNDGETLEKINKLLDMLDDNDDVVSVYHNANLPDEDDE